MTFELDLVSRESTKFADIKIKLLYVAHGFVRRTPNDPIKFSKYLFAFLSRSEKRFDSLTAN